MKKWKRLTLCAVALAVMSAGLFGCAKTPSQTANTTTAPANQTGETGYRGTYSQGETEGLKMVSGSGELKSEEGMLKVTSAAEEETILIDDKAPLLRNSQVEFVYDPVNDNEGGMYGAIVRYGQDGSWTMIGQEGVSGKDPVLTSWVMWTSDGKKQLLKTDGQRIYAGRVKPYTMKVKVVDNTVTLYLDNALIFSGEVDGMTQESGKSGILYGGGSGAAIRSLSVAEAAYAKTEVTVGEAKTIRSEAMEVSMDTTFPRVLKYQLKTGEEVLGQEIPCNEVEINNRSYEPEVTSEFEEGKVVYHIQVAAADTAFDVVFQTTDNVLRMEIQNIREGKEPVRTIHFPRQSLISMRSTDKGAKLRVNDYRTEQVIDLSTQTTQRAFETTSLAVLSSDTVAASINNGAINNRQEIAYQTVKAGEFYTTGLWTNEFQYKGLDEERPLDTLWTEVAVTGDRNGDQKVDYQDGAIARRDDIGTERLGSDEARNSFSSIAMDVGSIAQYPFLRILDNIKKFNGGTDGFGQLVLIKGYQSEGHDSSHPDFANISQRAGGVEDFKTLLEGAKAYGAKIGLHINHTEAYPEAVQYSEDLIAQTLGWTWYDDSNHIIRENDILNKEGGLEKRLDDLAAIADGNLSMIYVDTYQDSRWQSEIIQQKIKDLGWMLGTEYSEEMIKESTWSHTLNSKSLNYDTQGNLVRFVDNQTKDIFPNSPLFRGLVNRNNDAGFNGWQECKSYDATMENFYTLVLPQRYLANFPVNQWESETKVCLGRENQVVTEMVDGVNQITKDGRLVAVGNTVFLPWSPLTEDKIYHWNQDGGSTQWSLPVSWEDETQVKVFVLTDEGRTQEKILPVVDGAITLEAAAKQAYVVYKGSSQTGVTDLTSYNWGQGSPVKDMGFDSHTFGYGWEKSSEKGNTDHITFRDNAPDTAPEKDKADNNKGNTHIHMEGSSDGALTQTMTGLKGGETYSASVFLEGSEGRKLSISVTTPDGNTVSNYADDFTVAYGNPHNDRFGTFYQRVKLTFTQPEEATTAVIRLEAEGGNEDSFANFDNVRVTPVGRSDFKGHDFFEDFEHVDQEFGPFVCPTKMTQSHLSEKNGDVTQDVIDGRYSLKIRGNGNKEQKFNYVRTVSHRLRLEPNTTYTMGMDYMITDVAANKEILGGQPAFVVRVRSDKAAAFGDQAGKMVKEVVFHSTVSTPVSTGEITFTTGNYDDYYVDLYDETYSHEIIIDNFFVDKQ